MSAIEGFKVIVVPNGQNGDGGFQASILLFPELSGGATGTLADFPDLVDWPTTLKGSNVGFVITLTPPAKKGTTVAPIAITQPLANADQSFPLNSGLWTALFSAQTPYQARSAPSSVSGSTGTGAGATDFTLHPPLDAPVVSFPVSTITDFITGQYDTLPLDRKPTYADVQAVYGPVAAGLIGEAGQQTIARQAEQRRALANGKPALANDFSDATPAEALAAQQYYLTPPKPIRPTPIPTADNPYASFSPNPVEFHAALTFIGHYRALQRALGLAFDFTFPIDSDSVSSDGGDGWLISADLVDLGDEGYTAFVPQSPSGGTTVVAVVVSPPTQATVSRSAFSAQDPPGNGYSIVGGGQVPVGSGSSGGGISTHTMSVEMAGLNAASFAQKVQTLAAPVGADGSTGSTTVVPDQVVLPPTIDSAGITLAQVASAVFVIETHDRQGLLYEYYDPTSTTYQKYKYPLYASDLVRGLTLDVLDTGVGAAPGTWYTLHERNVTYQPVGGAQFTAFDDYDVAGIQNIAALGLAPTEETPQWYVSESLLRFDGWSNAVPFPSGVIQDADAQLNSDGPFSDVINITVSPGPVLDASNNPTVVLPRLRFGRSYQLAVRSVDLANNAIALAEPEGEYITDVIPFGRDDVVPSPDVYPQNGSTAYPITGEGLLKLVIRDTDGPNVRSLRAVAPPRVTPGFAITLGMFDIENGALPTDQATAQSLYTAVAALEGGHYVPPAAAPPTGTKTTPAPMLPTVNVTSGGTVDVTQTVPYIPDLLARGGALRVDSQSATSDPANNGLNAVSPLQFDFQPAGSQPSAGTFPPVNAYPVLLELVPGQPGATRSMSYSGPSGSRQVTVALQPADVVLLDLSCTFNPDDLKPAPAGYGLGATVQASQNFDAATALTGGCWAITPDVVVQLVYARQTPSTAPYLNALTVERNPGDTFATLAGEMTWSPNSTSKIDVIASWTDPVDNGAGTGPPEFASPSAAGSVVPPAQPVLTAPAPARPALDPTDPSSPTDPNSAVPAITGFASAGREVAQATDAFADGRHEFRDTKCRSVTYAAYGTSRFVEYFPEIEALGDPSQFQNPSAVAGEAIPGITVEVPSSARPAAVTISEVIPIYGWDGPTAVGTTKINSGRNPSALRIYIERPWWSSGDGELLGVITWPGAEAGASPTANLRKASASHATARHDSTRAHEQHAEHGHAEAAHGERRREKSSSAKHRVRPHHPARSAHASGPAVPVPSPLSEYVSDWGLDPVFGSAQKLPSAHPQLGSFPNATTDGTGVTLEEVSGAEVNVAGHPVFYDDVSDRWFADIAVDFGGAYNPMVRLAVTRYQPNSIAGVEIGRVSVVDVHALEQGRSVQVVKNSGTAVTVKLTGVSYTRAANRDTISPLYVTPTTVAPGQALVQVQRRDTSISDPTLGWVAVADAVTMDASIDGSGNATWTAKLTVPGVGSGYRLAILQYELILVEDERDDEQVGERLLYQDLIPLSFGTGHTS